MEWLTFGWMMPFLKAQTRFATLQAQGPAIEGPGSDVDREQMSDDPEAPMLPPQASEETEALRPPPLLPADGTRKWAEALNLSLESVERRRAGTPGGRSFLQGNFITALFETFWPSLLLMFCIQFVLDAVGYAQFLLLQLFLQIKEGKKPPPGSLQESNPVGYGMAVTLTIIFLNLALIFAGIHYGFWRSRVNMRMGGAIRAVLFRKVLIRPEGTEPEEEASESDGRGHTKKKNNKKMHLDSTSVFNLIHMDTEATEAVVEKSTETVLMPVRIAMAAAVLSSQVGTAWVLGLLVLIFFTLVMVVLTSISSALRAPLLEEKDQRVHQTQEALLSMRSVRTLGWEGMLRDDIRVTRDKEIGIQSRRLILSFMASFSSQAASILTSLVTIAVYVREQVRQVEQSGTDKFKLKASVALPVIGVLMQLAGPLTQFPWLLSTFIEGRIALRRLQAFSDERKRNDVRSLEAGAEKRESASPSPLSVSTSENGQSGTAPTSPTHTCPASHQNHESALPGSLCSQCESPQASRAKRLHADAHTETAAEAESGFASDGGVAPVLSFRSASLGYGGHTRLRGVNLSLEKGGVTVVVGPVGSGKSLMLLSSLGEVKLTDGSLMSLPLETGVGVGYSPQDCFLPAGSVRDAILAGRSFPGSMRRYERTIQACALEADFRSWPDGDRRRIDEGGQELSAGQRARVQLARAVFDSRQTLAVLDEPLCGLDPEVAFRVWSALTAPGRVCEGMAVLISMGPETFAALRKREVKEKGRRSCVQVVRLSHAGPEGGFVGVSVSVEGDLPLSVGPPSEGGMSNQPLSGIRFGRGLSGDVGDGSEARDGSAPSESSPLGYSYSQSDSDSSPFVERNQGKSRQRGLTDAATSAAALDASIALSISGGLNDSKSLLGPSSLDPEALASSGTLRGGNSGLGGGKGGEAFDGEEEGAVGNVHLCTYWWFLGSVGWVTVWAVVISVLAIGLLDRGSALWIARWTDFEAGKSPGKGDGRGGFLSSFLPFSLELSVGDQMWFLYGYAVICGLLLIANLVGFLLEATGGIRGATAMHNTLLDSVLVRAPIAFFDAFPTGKLLNRFSVDIWIMDFSLVQTVGIVIGGLTYLVCTVVILTWTSPFCIGLLPLLFYCVYHWVYKFYCHSARELRRRGLAALSLLLASFSEGISGSRLLRVMKLEHFAVEENLKRIDWRNRLHFVSNGCHHWAALWVQLLTWPLMAANTFIPFYIVWKSGFVERTAAADAGAVGVALTFSMQLAGLIGQQLYYWTDLEKQMCSVERVEEVVRLSSLRQTDSPEERERKMREADCLPTVTRLLSLRSSTIESDGIGGALTDTSTGEGMKKSPSKTKAMEVPRSPGVVVNRVTVAFDPSLYKPKAFSMGGAGVSSSTVYSSRDPRQEPGGFRALKGISLKVAPGERVGVVGRTGAGKSSLLNALAGLLPVSGGSLRVEGQDPWEVRRELEAAWEKGRRGRGVVGQRRKKGGNGGSSDTKGGDFYLCGALGVAFLPHRPLVVSGWTLRRFLDPSGQKSDDAIMAAMEELRLLDLVVDRRAEALRGASHSPSYQGHSVSLTVRLDPSALLDITLKGGVSLSKHGSQRGKEGEAKSVEGAVRDAGIKFTDCELHRLSLCRLLLDASRTRLLLIDEPPKAEETDEIEDEEGDSRDLSSRGSPHHGRGKARGFPSDLLDRLLSAHFRHCPVIVVAHHPESLKGCDRVIVMQEGRLFRECSHKDVETAESLAAMLATVEAEAALETGYPLEGIRDGENSEMVVRRSPVSPQRGGREKAQ